MRDKIIALAIRKSATPTAHIAFMLALALLEEKRINISLYQSLPTLRLNSCRIKLPRLCIEHC